ncbi:MAG: ATP-dependent DNA helicase [Armatimonadetes bacterium]|nr:ATP-dependent DNA helicase [Armatimonadota bacterium]
MTTAAALIEQAFERLNKLPGFVPRPDQVQAALLIGEMMESGQNAAIEAPTGLGKSLASLIPALAVSATLKKRIVIATYTNVLAEQYWRRDLPLAQSVLQYPSELTSPKTAFLIGKQRYVCLLELERLDPEFTPRFELNAELGIESEFREYAPKGMKWQDAAVPPVCAGRFCPLYDPCYYFKARREAEKSDVIITNHSVVITDGLQAETSEEKIGFLGRYDYLVLDEAHDFANAAQNGLEFEINESRLAMLASLGARIENSLAPGFKTMGSEARWSRILGGFKRGLDEVATDLMTMGMGIREPGILHAAPSDLLQHPQVQRVYRAADEPTSRTLTEKLSGVTSTFATQVEELLDEWRDAGSVRMSVETARTYLPYIKEAAFMSESFFRESGVAVTHLKADQGRAALRRDVVDLVEPLKSILWDRVPTTCVSATLAVDGNFDQFCGTTGFVPDFSETLPSPFDFSRQAALFLPPDGSIPDPTLARQQGGEPAYFAAVAKQLSEIINACRGRTLALFHSRREMEAVLALIRVSPDLPILTQGRFNAASVGDRFRRNTHSSLFALRSFWTGFDAPGATLSCVVLVRIPFEVPTEPSAIARMAWLQNQGRDAFREHTLPQSKMMIRQGAGRLIRQADDKGIIALLDPRFITKRYGEELLANLPAELRTFRDIHDAVGWIGLE